MFVAMNFIYYINRLVVMNSGKIIILIQNIYNALFTDKRALMGYLILEVDFITERMEGVEESGGDWESGEK